MRHQTQETRAERGRRLLNEIDGLSVPTLERICLWAAREIGAELPGLRRVTLSRPSLNESCTLELSGQ